MQDSRSSSFSSSEDVDVEQQESMLAEKYGALNLRKRVRVFQQPNTRRYFDSADWSLQQQGKLVPDVLLGYDCPIDQLPVKSEPTLPSERRPSQLAHVGWAEPAVLPVQVTRTVLDI